MRRRNPAPDRWTELLEMKNGKAWTLIWVDGTIYDGYTMRLRPVVKARAYVLFREATGKYVTTWFCDDITAVATGDGWSVRVPRTVPHQLCIYVDEKYPPDAEDLRKIGMESYFIMQRMVERMKELDAK